MSLSYVRRIEELAPLDTQGDGMRSFAGVLLATSVGDPSVVLIDEPEAFLHPPHARVLGLALVQDRAAGRQIFVATHSGDVLRGVLEASGRDMRVVRIRREADSNVVCVLENSRIRELWDDPLLRQSNILDGLFHEGVVVCESDGDCRFYVAVLDAIYSREKCEGRRPDLMFTHCGGKYRLPTVIKALRELGVPVCAIADFDVFSEERPLRTIVEALGEDWNGVVKDWAALRAAINDKKSELRVGDVKRDIEQILSDLEGNIFPTSKVEAIQKVLRRASPWSMAKDAGKSFVPRGSASEACERLFAKVRQAGLHVVEGGELEGFVRTIGSHGPPWVNEVLKKDLARDPVLEDARRFVRQIAAFFGA